MQSVLSRLRERLGPWLEGILLRFEIGREIHKVRLPGRVRALLLTDNPDSGKVRLAVRCFRSRGCKVRFSVRRSRNSRSRIVQPLRRERNERRKKQYET